MEKRPSLSTMDTPVTNLGHTAQAGTIASPDTPLSATRNRMSKVMKRLKKPKWNRRSRTASEALSEGYASSLSEWGSFSSSLLESSSCVSADDESNGQNTLSLKETSSEQVEWDNDSTVAIAHKQSSEVSTTATASAPCIVASKKRSTVAVQGDLERWFQAAHALLASKEMQAFVQCSNRVVASAIKTSAGTALTASGLMVKTAFLPVTVPLHAAASTTDLVINVAGGVFKFAVQDKKDKLKQLTENGGKESDNTYHTPAQDLLHNVFNFIPFVVKNTFKTVSPALGGHSRRRKRPQVKSSACTLNEHITQQQQQQQQSEQPDDFLHRLRLDIYPNTSSTARTTEPVDMPLPQDSKNYDSDDDDATARTDSTDNTASLPSNPSGASKADFSKFLLRVDDVNVLTPPDPASDKVLRTVYVDLDSEFSDENITKDALAQLIQRGVDVTASNPAVHFSCKMTHHDGMKSITNDIQWTPEGKTKNDVKDLTKLSPHGFYEALRHKVLIWSGKYRGPKYRGSDNALFMARGVVNGSPREFTKMLWDSTRTKEYNNYCLGRSDVVVINDELSNGGNYGAKVIKSETKVPFTGLSVFLSAVMHAKALGDRPEDGYMILSRSLNTGRAGYHVGKAAGVDESNKNEIILGVNIMRPVPGHPELTDLISVSQVAASMVPPFLAFRIGMMGVEDFFKNVRS